MKESLATRRAKACLQGADNAPTVRLPVQRFSSSKISRAGACRLVPNHSLLFAIFPLMILVCNAQYRPVSRGWFAIWFANSSPTPAPTDDAEQAQKRKARREAGPRSIFKASD